MGDAGYDVTRLAWVLRDLPVELVGRVRSDFSTTYGHDLTNWPGLPVLTSLRDLHTLGTFIRRTEQGDTEAAAQLAVRLNTLDHGHRTASWATR